MSRPTRLLAAMAALLVLPALLLPLWEVRLLAPQYPEGLGLRIGAHAVTGLSPHDLDNINGLNHYIGMRRITPEAIPELRIMPVVLAALGALGMFAALRGSRRLLAGWLGLFVLLGVAGLVDFWRWEYDYGHHLDLEHAIIIVPGMSYQPPLLGTKQLLNFTASSWPGPGAWALGLAFALGAAALWRARREAAA